LCGIWILEINHQYKFCGSPGVISIGRDIYMNMSVIGKSPIPLYYQCASAMDRLRFLRIVIGVTIVMKTGNGAAVLVKNSAGPMRIRILVIAG